MGPQRGFINQIAMDLIAAFSPPGKAQHHNGTAGPHVQAERMQLTCRDVEEMWMCSLWHIQHVLGPCPGLTQSLLPKNKQARSNLSWSGSLQLSLYFNMVCMVWFPSI